MANGFDWEGLTAKPIEDLTTDDKLIVLIGEIRSMKNAVSCVPDHQKRLDRHDNYFLWGGLIVTSILIPIFLKLFNVL